MGQGQRGESGTSRKCTVTEAVRDVFDENCELRKTQRFLTLAFSLSLVTNVLFALKYILG